MDRSAAHNGRARLAFRRPDGDDRKYRARDLGKPRSAVDPTRTAWCKYPAVSRRPTFPSELADSQPAAMRSGARIVCCRRIRFDRAARTARNNPAKMAVL